MNRYYVELPSFSPFSYSLVQDPHGPTPFRYILADFRDIVFHACVQHMEIQCHYVQEPINNENVVIECFRYNQLSTPNCQSIATCILRVLVLTMCLCLKYLIVKVCKTTLQHFNVENWTFHPHPLGPKEKVDNIILG